MALNSQSKQIAILLVIGFAMVAKFGIFVNCEDEPTECSTNNDDINEEVQENLSSEPLSKLYKFAVELKGKVSDYVDNQLSDKCSTLEELYSKMKERVANCYTFDPTWGVLKKGQLNLDRFGFSQPALKVLKACREWRGENELHLGSQSSFWFN